MSNEAAAQANGAILYDQRLVGLRRSFASTARRKSL